MASAKQHRRQFRGESLSRSKTRDPKWQRERARLERALARLQPRGSLVVLTFQNRARSAEQAPEAPYYLRGRFPA